MKTDSASLIAAARLIAARTGDDFDDAPRDREHWEQRKGAGLKSAYWRRPGKPTQADYLDMAREIMGMANGEIRQEA